LLVACKAANLETVKILLHKNADTRVKDKVVLTHNYDCFNFMLHIQEGNNALLLAAMSGNAEMLKFVAARRDDATSKNKVSIFCCEKLLSHRQN
jgi:hypothetical protein